MVISIFWSWIRKLCRSAGKLKAAPQLQFQLEFSYFSTTSFFELFVLLSLSHRIALSSSHSFGQLLLFFHLLWKFCPDFLKTALIARLSVSLSLRIYLLLSYLQKVPFFLSTAHQNLLNYERLHSFACHQEFCWRNLLEFASDTWRQF